MALHAGGPTLPSDTADRRQRRRGVLLLSRILLGFVSKNATPQAFAPRSVGRRHARIPSQIRLAGICVRAVADSSAKIAALGTARAPTLRFGIDPEGDRLHEIRPIEVRRFEAEIGVARESAAQIVVTIEKAQLPIFGLQIDIAIDRKQAATLSTPF